MYERSRTIRTESVVPGDAADGALRAEARRLAWIASFFAWAGWLMAIYAGVGGVLWWLDLTSHENLTFVDAFGMSLDVVAGPLFLALILAGLGHVARLFALYVTDESST